MLNSEALFWMGYIQSAGNNYDKYIQPELFISQSDDVQRRGADYYSIRKSRIVLALFFRTDDGRRAFCVKHDLLPPDGIRGTKKLNAWIDERRAEIEAREPLLPAYPIAQPESACAEEKVLTTIAI